MTSPQLTIIVPTFNRCNSLELLLRSLKTDLERFGNDVVVYVSDNASTDGTSSILGEIQTDWPQLAIYRHSTNVGADRNFSHCVKQVRSRWFWIVSDDDLPKPGVIAQILGLLINYQPALIYIRSEWMSPVYSANQGESVGGLSVVNLDAISFAAAVNTWLTFVSGMVIDREALMATQQGDQIDRFNGTSLIQLGWILPLLNTDGPFLYVKDKGVLATSGNTGGYSVLKTFCSNFPAIINEFFGGDQKIREAILVRHVRDYLPGLIWNVRFNNIGFFKAEESGNQIWQQLKRYPMYWFFLWPIINLNKNFAWPFYAILRLISKFRLKIKAVE